MNLGNKLLQGFCRHCRRLDAFSQTLSYQETGNLWAELNRYQKQARSEDPCPP